MDRKTSGMRARALALLLLVLVAGAVLGAALVTARLSPPQPPAADTTAVSVDGDPFGRLDLTDAQRESIDSILADMGAVTDSLLATSRQALLAEARAAETGIRSVLTPDQAARFDSLLVDLGGIRMRVERRMVVSDSADGERARSPSAADDPR